MKSAQLKVTFGDARDGALFSIIHKLMQAIVGYQNRVPLAQFMADLDNEYQAKLKLYHIIRGSYGVPSKQEPSSWLPDFERRKDFDTELQALYAEELLTLPMPVPVRIPQSRANSLQVDAIEMGRIVRLINVEEYDDGELQVLRDRVATLEAAASAASK